MHAPSARPLLLPELRVLWRDAQTAQFGTDPVRARVLSGLPEAAAAFFALLDGTRTEPELVSQASTRGLDPVEVHDLLAALRAAGALVDNDPTDGLPPKLATAARRRLASELAALTLSGTPHAGAVLAARASRQVVIRGGGRLAVPVATLLATAGIGKVHLAVSGTVTDHDVVAAGVPASEVGRPRATAMAEAVRAVAPEVDTRAPRSSRSPDLTVLTALGQPAVVEAMTPQARHAPHLVLSVRDGVAIVGPLIVPGVTACLYCIHLHRVDRDPAWPALEAQLESRPEPRPQACDAALATAAASLAAMQVVSSLDGGTPESFSASLELRSPNLEIRRRTWDIHPRCGCRARAHRAS